MGRFAPLREHLLPSQSESPPPPLRWSDSSLGRGGGGSPPPSTDLALSCSLPKPSPTTAGTCHRTDTGPLGEPPLLRILPKPVRQPGSYVIQVPRDLVLRIPREGNASRAKAYARRRGCCFLVFAWLGALLFLLAVVADILYLVFRPRVPQYSIDALSIASFNLSAASVSPAFDATVRAENPNKKVGIFYRDGNDVTVASDGVTLCTGAWPAFYQSPGNVTVFVAALKGSAIRLSSAARQALVTAETQRQVPLEIDVKVPVRIKFGAVTSWTITVKLKCDVTVTGLTENAKIVFKNCRVKVKLFKFLGL
ncbi:Late embryogenesis abundant protein [Musa troglodytarum]|uniref:Late embryogenesis abundant protein n=1 Tax=Musa troglodytarum TaxID=320322 RepID=A0A9E7FEN7_9LILI|nr:Late embryogenesis abundant protein [Musa troglodytarum]